MMNRPTTIDGEAASPESRFWAQAQTYKKLKSKLGGKADKARATVSLGCEEANSKEPRVAPKMVATRLAHLPKSQNSFMFKPRTEVS